MEVINPSMKSEPVHVGKLYVTLCIAPYGMDTEFFCSWFVEDVLGLSNARSLANSSLIFEVELSRRLKGTDFILQETCNYGEFNFSFYLPMKKSPGREINQLKTVVDKCVKDVIKNYGLEALKVIYDEWNTRQEAVLNDDGVIFDMTKPFINMNISALKNRKIRQLGNVYTYLAARAARKIPHVQSMIREFHGEEATYG